MTHSDFQKEISLNHGISISQGAIAKWCTETRIPRKTEMNIIYKVTKGQVTPMDFYDL